MNARATRRPGSRGRSGGSRKIRNAGGGKSSGGGGGLWGCPPAALVLFLILASPFVGAGYLIHRLT